MSVEISNLSFTYAGTARKALQDIDFTIPRGAFVGVVGPSGCGKTTLARCLNALIPHFYPGKMTGDVIVDGWNTQDHPAYEMAQKVGLVFQNPENQLVAPNAEREIAFGPENLGIPRGEIRNRVENLIHQIHLEDVRDKAPYELSGGEQQRIAIAAILALQPAVLVLDEPTSNLDPVSAYEVLQLLRRLNQDLKLTILLIEHRLEFVAPLVQELIVMNEGLIIAQGHPASVLTEKKVVDVGVAVPPLVQLIQKLGNEKLCRDFPLSVVDAVKAILQEVSG
ncbi:MAG: energy-coupling factor ABC transporter ATP-binding protein [Promethearchaeota archaeon]